MHELLLIVVIAIVTLFTRTIPFLLFKNHKNAFIEY
ncbi:AzlD domain-containing protein, partial [Coprobacillus cateniformis]|nr:AzlD domain-containing protein [Coprobacillus cateniformis]